MSPTMPNDGKKVGMAEDCPAHQEKNARCCCERLVTTKECKPGGWDAWGMLASYSFNIAFGSLMSAQFAAEEHLVTKMLDHDAFGKVAVVPLDPKWVTRLYMGCILSCGSSMIIGMATWGKYPYVTQLFCVFAVTCAAFIRWYGIVVVRSYWLVFASMVLLGVAMGVALVAPVLLAQWWLKPAHRTLGVAIMCQSNYFGWLAAMKVVPMWCQGTEEGMVDVTNKVGMLAVLNVLACALYRAPSKELLENAQAEEAEQHHHGIFGHEGEEGSKKHYCEKQRKSKLHYGPGSMRRSSVREWENDEVADLATAAAAAEQQKVHYGTAVKSVQQSMTTEDAGGGTIRAKLEASFGKEVALLCLSGQFWVRAVSFAVMGAVSFTIPGVQSAVLREALQLSNQDSADFNVVFLTCGCLAGIALGCLIKKRSHAIVTLKICMVGGLLGTMLMATCVLAPEFLVGVDTATGAEIDPRRVISAITPWLYAGNALTGATTLGFIGLALESLGDFPVEETYAVGAVEVMLQLGGGALPEVADGTMGFVYCFLLLLPCVFVFLFGYAPFRAGKEAKEESRSEEIDV